MFEKIKNLLVEFANVDREKITIDAILKDDLDIDSLYAVEMILALETAFHIQIEWEEMEKLVTVSDVVKLVESKVKE